MREEKNGKNEMVIAKMDDQNKLSDNFFHVTFVVNVHKSASKGLQERRCERKKCLPWIFAVEIWWEKGLVLAKIFRKVNFREIIRVLEFS